MRTMMAAGAAALALACAVGAHAQASRYERLFEQLWRTVGENFFDPRMNGVDWAAVKARYRPQLAGVDTDAEFQALGQKMIRELGTSHLDLLPPPAKAQGPALGVAPESFRTLGDKLYVTRGVAGGSLRTGDRILAPFSALTGPLNGAGAAKVMGCDGVEREASLRFAPPVNMAFQSASAMTTPAGKQVGYLKIDRFNDDVLAFTDQAMETFAAADGLIIDVRANSGGSLTALYLAERFMSADQRLGVTMMARPVLAKLGRRPTPQEALAAPRFSGLYRPADTGRILKANGGRAMFVTKPAARRFTKPVTVLMGPRTGSAAEGFAWMMKLATHGRLIGRPTAGALLRGDTLKLADGWQVTVPVVGLWGPDGEWFGDRRAEPHVPVEWTEQDICAGRDPDLVKAFEHIDAGG